MSMFSRAIGRDKKKNQTRDKNAAALAQQNAPGGVLDNQRKIDVQAGTDLAGGNTATDTALARTTAFDPTAAIQRYANAQWDTAINDPTKGLKRQLTDLGGRSVGAGRLDTGFYDADQGDVISNVMRGYGNSVASTAVTGAGMEQANNATLYGEGADKTTQGLDLLTGRYNEQQTTAADKAARARSKKRGIGSAIGGLLGGVAGGFFGGPQGASTGYGLGAGIGGGF